jgi:hypothetical protein
MSRAGGSVDPDRLAGREYDVTLSYVVEFRLSEIAGPEEWQAIESAREVATPAGCVDPVDWDLIHKEAGPVRNIWMDDPEAPKAAGWLDEPHVPSEETYWDDSRHFVEAQ